MHGTNKFKHISRISSDKSKCWFVRISCCNEIHSRTFSDKKNGGKYIALLNAIIWRDNTLKLLNKPLSPRTIQIGSPSTNTGIVGIREIIYKERRFRGGEWRQYSYPVFEITYFPEPGKLKRDRVAINKHGRDKALEIAITKNNTYREKALSIGADRYPGIQLSTKG